MDNYRYKTDSHQLLKSKRFKTWTLKLFICNILMIFSLAGVGRVSGRDRRELERQERDQGSEYERIVCRNSRVKVKREEILKFIESFCAEAIGQKFGGDDSDGEVRSEMKEIYTIDPAHRVSGDGMASHLLLHLKSINDCSFSVDYSCGRFLTRPTDECNIGEEAKQGGYVANGCSLWKTIPLS